MTATEAASINSIEEGLDFSAAVVQRVRDAAHRRERSIEVEAELMTATTRKRLAQLGYVLAPCRVDKYVGKEAVCDYIVAW